MLDPSTIKAIHFQSPLLLNHFVLSWVWLNFATVLCTIFLPLLPPPPPHPHELAESNTPFEWTKQCQQAFDDKKNILQLLLFYISPSPHSRIILEIDTSDHGIGNSLTVMETLNDVSEQEHLLAYGSKEFDYTEQGWNIVEKEAYVIIYAVGKHRH